MLPINAEQGHSVEGDAPIEVGGYLALFMEKQFLQDMANALYGRADVYFRNTEFALDWEMHNLLRSFMNEAFNRQQGYDFILHSITLQLAVNFLRKVESKLTDKTKPP